VKPFAACLSQLDAGSLAIEAQNLSRQRAALQERLGSLSDELSRARADEYRDVVVSGKSWAPSDAARWIAKDRSAWLPSPVILGAPLPLSEGEVIELYSTNGSVPVEAERELAHRLPEAAQMPSPGEFEGLVNTRGDLAKTDRDFRFDLWQAAASAPTAESLSAILKKVQAAIDPLKGGETWKMAAVYAGRNGGPHRDPWDNLVAQIEQAHYEIAKSQEILLRHAPALPSANSFEDQKRAALEIHTHLRQNGTLGFVTLLTHKHWKLGPADGPSRRHALEVPRRRHRNQRRAVLCTDSRLSQLEFSHLGTDRKRAERSGLPLAAILGGTASASRSGRRAASDSRGGDEELLPVLVARVNRLLWERNERTLGQLPATSPARLVAFSDPDTSALKSLKGRALGRYRGLATRNRRQYAFKCINVDTDYAIAGRCSFEVSGSDLAGESPTRRSYRRHDQGRTIPSFFMRK
jgi:hypothetical protein